jgi:hypothetical protein
MPNQMATRMIVRAGATPGPLSVKPLEVVLMHEDGTEAGVVKMAAAQADSTATTVEDLVDDFNALLAKLRTAGIIDT